jgi:hypothetical protein
MAKQGMSHLGTAGILAPQSDQPHQGNCRRGKDVKIKKNAHKRMNFEIRKEVGIL